MKKKDSEASLQPSSFIPHPSNILHPSKGLGRIFSLIRMSLIESSKAVGPRSDETIIEIGPGKGALTERLVEQGRPRCRR